MEIELLLEILSKSSSSSSASVSPLTDEKLKNILLQSPAIGKSICNLVQNLVESRKFNIGNIICEIIQEILEKNQLEESLKYFEFLDLEIEENGTATESKSLSSSLSTPTSTPSSINFEFLVPNLTLTPSSVTYKQNLKKIIQKYLQIADSPSPPCPSPSPSPSALPSYWRRRLYSSLSSFSTKNQTIQIFQEIEDSQLLQYCKEAENSGKIPWVFQPLVGKNTNSKIPFDDIHDDKSEQVGDRNSLFWQRFYHFIRATKFHAGEYVLTKCYSHIEKQVSRLIYSTAHLFFIGCFFAPSFFTPDFFR